MKKNNLIPPVLLITALFTLWGCKTPTGSNAQNHAYTNALAEESSPYLLQHAHNPVNWYPWKEEALKKAEAENKMLIISVGYSACHWCHVMEHESFEDTTIARIMNEHFINIKVDREERPDVDDVYMTACQLSTGKGCGWPLNAFALPNGQPVWAGTYFPKKEWEKVLQYWIKTYAEEPEQVTEYAAQLTLGIEQQDAITFSDNPSAIQAPMIDDMANTMLETMDFKLGGRMGAPKFPMPSQYEFLLQHAYHTGNEKSAEIVHTTLREMAFGGIYDQLGGGFARYSTDAKWLVPHFEKMLYDNAQLVSLYSHAFQVTRDPFYQSVIEESLTFIGRELTDKKGGFYSSLDADSEGEEGKFYVWKNEEIDQLIGAGAEQDLFKKYYGIKAGGNWEHDKNIFHTRMTLGEFAEKEKQDLGAVQKAFAAYEEKIMQARATRVRPGLDDKILSSWNALMLMGYLDAYRALGNEDYLITAERNAKFLKKEMIQSDFRLNRNYKDDKSSINAFLDDYALTIQAFIELYQCTFDESWLTQADGLAQYALQHFASPDDPFFNYTSDIDPPLIARKKELADNVIPGSNSSFAKALYELGTLLYRPEFQEIAKKMVQNMAQSISNSNAPNYYTNWLSLFPSLVTPPYEVAILGEKCQDKRATMQREYLPNVLFLGGQKEGSLELLENKLQEGSTKVYVCQNKVCKFPVEDAAKAVGQIEKALR